MLFLEQLLMQVVVGLLRLMWQMLLEKYQNGHYFNMREDDYKLSMEKLYQQNKLLISALYEIYGEEIQSTSLFCLEHDISFLTRNKIMMVLNKYSMQHTMSEYLFWKEKIYSEVKDFPNLDNCEFKKMLLLFWKDYVITDE
jgi:fructose-1,6-bisphosphatase